VKSRQNTDHTVAPILVDGEITARIRSLFTARGITQRELADAIGVDASEVSMVLSETRFVTDIHKLASYARYFGVTVGYLLNESERGRSAEAVTLLHAFEPLEEKDDRDLVLGLALSLKRRQEARQASATGASQTPARPEESPRTPVEPPPPPTPKRR
jgi:transcriptional regulator with XRE-family HTH domain